MSFWQRFQKDTNICFYYLLYVKLWTLVLDLENCFFISLGPAPSLCCYRLRLPGVFPWCTDLLAPPPSLYPFTFMYYFKKRQFLIGNNGFSFKKSYKIECACVLGGLIKRLWPGKSTAYWGSGSQSGRRKCEIVTIRYVRYLHCHYRVRHNVHHWTLKKFQQAGLPAKNAYHPARQVYTSSPWPSAA